MTGHLESCLVQEGLWGWGKKLGMDGEGSRELLQVDVAGQGDGCPPDCFPSRCYGFSIAVTEGVMGTLTALLL